MTETKSDILVEICDLVSISEYSTTVGSSIPRRFFSDLLDIFGIPDEGDAVAATKKLLNLAGIEWNSSYASEATPSGGGGTITLDGLKVLRNAVALLLDELENANFQVSSKSDLAKPDEWTLLRGQSILRAALHDRYSGIRQGGIAPSRITKNIFLFTDDASNHEHGYEKDYWLNDLTFIYCGDGQTGNQKLTRRNLQVLNHVRDGRKLRLFSPVSGKVTYLGEMQIDSNAPYELVKGIGRDGKSREVIMFRLNRVIEKHEYKPSDNKNVGSNDDFGQNYVFANEEPREIDISGLFTIDPNLLDRALQIHSITQNTVANWVIGENLFPQSPLSTECDFDIAWESSIGRVVCEVKSINDDNEVHQLRLGLGQVLEYAYKLNARPVLMVSRKPSRQYIIDAASKAGVLTLWPEILNKYSARSLQRI